tara:strand:+ start:1763 stop:3022 length:1260 start_codon:yes stop_codon:yes gene_type:complete
MPINLRQLLLDRAARGIGTGGGLMGTQSNAGLLGNLNPLFLGASIIGSGMQGRDPFSSVLPAATQAAQLQQLLTPEEKERNIIKDVEGRQRYADTGELVFPDVKTPTKEPNYKTLFNEAGDRVDVDLNNPTDTSQISNYISKGYSFSKFDQKDDRLPVQKLAEELDPTKGEVYTSIIKNKIAKETLNPTLLLLKEAGIEKNDPRYREAILSSIAKTPEGFAAASPLTSKGKIDNAVIGGNYSVKGLDKLTKFAELTTQSPEIFGTTGRVLKFGSNALKEFNSVFGTEEQELIKIDDDVKSLLKNKDFSSIDQLQNSLSINLARVRNPSGKLMKDMINDAKDDTNFTGLGGVQVVREKLLPLYDELEADARQKFELAGYDEQTINNILEPKRNMFLQKIGAITQPQLILGEDGVYRVQIK